MTKNLFKRSGGYFIGLLISKAFNLFLFIYVAKLLLPESFGSIIYYSTILSLVTLVADFGTVQWYQKQISFIANKAKLINQLINARLITFIISLLIIILYLTISQRFNLIISLTLLISLVPESLLSIFDGYYLEKKEPSKISIKQISRSVILTTFVIIFANQLTVGIFAVAVFISAVVNMVWFVPWNYVKKFKLDIKTGIKTLKKSSQYAVLITTSYAYSRGDSIIIENTIGSASLGVYSAAYRYLEGLSMLPNALAQNLFHIAAKKDNLKLNQVFKIMFTMLVLGLGAGLGTYFLADLLTVKILGQEYLLAKTILQIFSLVVVLFFINAPLSSIVQSSKQLKKFIPWGIGNTVGNVLLNIWLIPIYGILAAAWVMLVTEVTGLVINIFFTTKLYRKNK